LIGRLTSSAMGLEKLINVLKIQYRVNANKNRGTNIGGKLPSVTCVPANMSKWTD